MSVLEMMVDDTRPTPVRVPGRDLCEGWDVVIFDLRCVLAKDGLVG